ncbi:glycosyltransferase family 2 protein [Sagittula salina]|uniref:Glycosyltransferase n=1 Tax=Sagittula salina TaxID=2820268 RepID=A0A940MPI6_9RHOB|nr:glycosyltransferase [Sagittula salina]MBP0483099.1 glycosyltransferase [Sagittula salina]
MALPVSVVVVSRHRPEALSRCLTGLSQLDYPDVELVVVACPAGLAALAARADAPQVKAIPFDEANISTARNLGVAAAAGAVIAFIDDDAVPEPMWLRHLTAPFEDEEVAAAGGFVLGRNGISFQWRARTVDRAGQAAPLAVDDSHATVLPPVPDRAIRTEGTNMAVRRAVLAEMGGFDPAFRFFHDEADLNMRLAAAGHATAIVPLAQVHHGFAASARRARDRSPRDLTEIAASQQVFLRKHCPPEARAAAWDTFRAEQHLRLLRWMQRGPLDPLDLRRLMAGFQRGRRAGEDRPLHTLPPIHAPNEGFRPFPTRPDAPRRLFAGRPWQAPRLRAEAEKAVRRGEIVTLILLSPSALYHRVRFAGEGYWEQTGGLFGRSQRQAPIFQPWRFTCRIDAEARRFAAPRGQFSVTYRR